MASDSDGDVEMMEVFDERPTETFSLALQNVASGRGFDREGAADDDDSGAEWDEVEATVDAPAPPRVEPRTAAEPLEIVIERAPSNVIGGKIVGPKRKVASPEERAARLQLHKVHTVCLLAAARARNEMINDELLHARLMSKVPLRIQTAFQSISKVTTPAENDRSRLFDAALHSLVSWWWQCFDVVEDVEGERTRTFADVAAELEARGITSTDDLIAPEEDEAKARKGKGKAPKVLPFAPHEVIRSVQSLMKRSVTFKGTRDMSAQLFTATCRALGIPARLVCSLQPVSWRATTAKAPKAAAAEDDEDEDEDDTAAKSKKRKRGAAKKTPAKKRRRTGYVGDPSTADSDDDVEFEEIAPPISTPSIGGRKARGAVVKGKGSASTPINISDADSTDHGSSSAPTPRIRANRPVKLRSTKPAKSRVKLEESPEPDPSDMAVLPVYWTEVYSRSEKRWISVDATRKLIRAKAREKLEPARTNKAVQLIYVVGFEVDGYARDVTQRYAKNFATHTVKERPTTRKAGEPDWWKSTFAKLERPYTLERNELEDEELNKASIDVGMPTTQAGFKNHALYVLADDLKREEVLDPRQRKIGIFRTTDVFPRSAVLNVKAPEGWMREGRRVRTGEQPMKFVKRRAVTINRKREQEMAKLDGEEPPQQGLYAMRQTELAMPDPIVDGIIPRNQFGNMDIFADHMVPPGARHLRFKGIAKIAKKLGVSYAEANTGFEFRKQRAMPVIEGIVVAEDTAETVLDAFREHEKAAAERAQAKFEERNLKRWKKLIEGIFVRERLQTDYKPAKTPAKKAKKATAAAPAVEEQPNELRAVADDEEDLDAPVASTSKPKPVKKAAKVVPNAALPRSAAEIARAADAEMAKRARRRFGGAAAALSDSEEDEAKDDEEAPYVPTAGPSTRAAASNGRTTRRSAAAIVADTESADSSAGPALRKRSTAAAQAVREALQGDDGSDAGDSSDARAFEYEDGSD